MAVISDLLGIRHHTTSRGSTVRRDFLEQVAVALGSDPAAVRQLEAKDDVLAEAVRRATGAPIDPGLYSPGATVTNETLQVIADGIMTRGVPDRVIPAPGSRAEVVLEGAEPSLDPDDLADVRERRLVELAVREGRNLFRTALVEAYGGCCAVTGCDAAEALEAAHIYPYRGPATNRVTNGLLLRADIHALFDRGSVSIHEATYRVLVKPHLLATRYAYLADEGRLRLPRRSADRPAVAALRLHREWAGL